MLKSGHFPEVDRVLPWIATHQSPTGLEKPLLQQNLRKGRLFLLISSDGADLNL
jgi:hypothetical protein